MTNKISFENNQDGTFEVRSLKDASGCDWDTLGVLQFDQLQSAWVFWQAGTDQGVTYGESLKETEEAITAEMN